MSDALQTLEELLRKVLTRIQDQEYLTMTEAADLLRWDENTVRNKLAKGIFGGESTTSNGRVRSV
jgi:DNA-directed RNA polymerase specialized sigma24 family protein